MKLHGQGHDILILFSIKVFLVEFFTIIVDWKLMEVKTCSSFPWIMEIDSRTDPLCD